MHAYDSFCESAIYYSKNNYNLRNNVRLTLDHFVPMVHCKIRVIPSGSPHHASDLQSFVSLVTLYVWYHEAYSIWIAVMIHGTKYDLSQV